jgi:hypothetical protein
MSAIWAKAKADALKILGSKADVPDPPDTIQKAHETLTKAWEEFNKSRTDIEAKSLAVQNANDAVINAMQQFMAKIEKADFKLDSKNKDELKKIQQARKLLTDVTNVPLKDYKDDDKMLEQLDKHIEQLGKYEQKATL